MRILSIDPAWAKPMAFAYFRDGRLCYFDRVEELEKIPDHDIDYVVTEDPYPGGNIKKYSSKGWAETYGNLKLAVGMVIQFSKSIGAQYKLIRPIDWKSFYGLTKKTPANIQDTTREQITGIQADRDLQDAVLIGKYFVEHLSVRLEPSRVE